MGRDIGKNERAPRLRRFERTWIFYLSYCEAAFRLRAIRDVQLTFCRSYSA